MKYRAYNDFNKNWINDIKVGFGKNAWYVQKPLSECRNLFVSIESDLVVHFFDCDCGKNQIYINTSDDSKKHICKKCNRENFTFLQYADRKTAYVNLENIYSFKRTSKHYIVICYLKYPKYIDIISNSLIYRNKIAYELRMDMKCTYSSRISYRISDEVKNQARIELLNFIGQDLQKRIKNFKVLEFDDSVYERKEHIVNFFIKNPALTEADFYYIDNRYIEIIPTKENHTVKKTLDNLLPQNAKRALKKSLYENYQHCMKEGYFCVVNKIVIFYAFKDQNFSRKLLENNVSFCVSTEEKIENEITCFKALFAFLKNFYTEKELFKICLQICEFKQYWEDMVMMYRNSKEQIEDTFTRVNANIIHIHNAFISCIKYNNETISFKYPKKEKLCMGLHEKLKYVLPRDSKMLFNWGTSLRNCLGSYARKIENRQSVIVGIFESKKLKYVLEIDLENKKILQMSAFANKAIPKPQAEAIVRWHKNLWLEA